MSMHESYRFFPTYFIIYKHPSDEGAAYHIDYHQNSK